MKVEFIGEGGKCRGEIDDAVPDFVKKYIDENAEDVAGEIEFRATGTTVFLDKTGRLRKALKARKSKYEDGGWIVGAWAPHAWVVEYGHDLINSYTGKKVGHVGGRSYLRKALNDSVTAARAKFEAR
jgi:hypothetical protein